MAEQVTRDRAIKYLEEIAQALGDEVEVRFSSYEGIGFPWLFHKGLDIAFLQIDEKQTHITTWKRKPSDVLYITVEIGYERGGKKFNEKKATGMDLPAVIEYTRDRIESEIRRRAHSQRVSQIKETIEQEVKQVMGDEAYKVDPLIRDGAHWVKVRYLYLPVDQLEKFLEIVKENGWEM